MKATGIILLLLAWQISFSQWSDSFTDGDFTSDPAWSGDTTRFTVENYVLRLTAPAAAGTSFLTTISNSINDATWQFSLRMAFNPSANNYVKIYLAADHDQLNAAVNGYYVMVGNTADEISLYRQDGLASTKIIDGADGRVDLSTVEVSIKVTRTAAGGWQMDTKLAGETGWVNEGTVVDERYFTSSYFGIACVYTSTRADKFYFDDFIVSGDSYVDTSPPKIDTVFAPTPQAMQVRFNEAIDTVSAGLTGNYTLNEDIQPGKVITGDSLVVLLFAETLKVLNQLAVTSVADRSGNPMADTTIQVIYISPEPVTDNDVVINEIMADPVPGVGLPETEYVELYNTTGRAINMTGWSFGDKNTLAYLPEVLLLPDSLLILTAASNAGVLSTLGTTVGLSPWPSLNNSGDSLVLLNAEGVPVDIVVYTDHWYQDSDKASGGWSLERINPGLPCSGYLNWAASTSVSGGTPGKANAILNNADLAAPQLIALKTEETSITLTFDEPIANLSDAIISPQQTVIATRIDYNQLVIMVDQPFTAGENYTLTLPSLSDCLGNTVTNLTFPFIYYPTRYPGFGDLLITEIMADPEPAVGLPEYEYLEIVNKAPARIILGGLILADQLSETTLPAVIMEPGERLILTKTTAAEAFTTYGNTLGVTNWPSLNNTGDLIALLDTSRQVINAIKYDESWYQDEAKAVGGWSLELIDENNYCRGAEAWTASTNPTGGSPGMPNQQVLLLPDEHPPKVAAARALRADSILIKFDKALADRLPVFSFALLPILGGGFTDYSHTACYIKTTSLPANRPYRLTINQITGCNGLTANDEVVTVILPGQAEPGDLVISEVLFNPVTNGVDFIEVYNYSNNYLSLENWLLSNGETAVTISDDQLLSPYAVRVYTSDPDQVSETYPGSRVQNIFQQKIPAMADNNGRLFLSTPDKTTIDSLVYNENWHFPYLESVEGVSLERVSMTHSGFLATSWASTPGTAGYATPGFINHKREQYTGAATIRVEPRVFKPDNAGQNDFTTIYVRGDKSGMMATIAIYNLQGQPVRTLANNTLLRGYDTFIWDGTDNYGALVPLGHYLIVVNIITSSGITQTFREKVVVATGF